MDLLHELIVVLEPPEVESLASLKLEGQEKKVFDFFLKEGYSDPKTHPADQLHISVSHFHKISSVLLGKIYRHFSGGEDDQLFAFLAKKDLSRHLLKELKRKERSIPANAEVRSPFYLSAFRHLQELGYRDWDEKTVQGYAKKYLQSKNGKEQEVLDLQLQILTKKMLASGAAVTAGSTEFLELSSKYGALLEKLDKKVASFPGQAAEYRFHRAAAVYQMHYKHDFKEALRHLASARTMLPKLNIDNSAGEAKTLNCRIAELYYYNSEFDRAFELYRKLFPGNQYKEKSVYDLAKYVQVAIITGHFREAEQVLDHYFKTFVSAGTRGSAIAGCVLYAKYHLCKGEYDKAPAYINKGFQLNRKNVHFQYEAELRMLQNCYFMLGGDFDTAEQLAEKNIKYFGQKGPGGSLRHLSGFHKLIKSLISDPDGDFNTSSLRELYFQYQQGSNAVYGKLLDQMMGHQQIDRPVRRMSME